MHKVFALTLLFCFASAPALAMDTLQQKSVTLRVGGSERIGTFAQHRKDCSPIGGATINITRPPTLGRIAKTENSPVVTTFSLNGSCLGAKLLGTRVDYFATARGVDTFEFDVIYLKGSLHYVVTATNR